MSAETETIDAMLERYLTLLDSYTQLRDSLNAIQAGMYQHLARANFSADRGIRYYVQDYYDERMQATRRISISAQDSDTTSTPVFVIKTAEAEFEPTPKSLDAEKNNKGTTTPGSHEPNGDEKIQQPETSTDDSPSKSDDQQAKKAETKKDSQSTSTNPEKVKKAKSHDPLRWFGILTPLALRQAQSSAVKAVEEIIPQLASISAEMASVELEVRRARKRRAKAEKEKEKKRLGELEKGVGGLEVTEGGQKETSLVV